MSDDDVRALAAFLNLQGVYVPARVQTVAELVIALAPRTACNAEHFADDFLALVASVNGLGFLVPYRAATVRAVLVAVEAQVQARTLAAWAQQYAAQIPAPPARVAPPDDFDDGDPRSYLEN